MDVFQLKAGRYLLYLDILGFSQLVATRDPKDVYKIVDTVLVEFHKRSKRLSEFRTLYFSDTIICYQVPAGWGSWAFSDIYAMAAMAWSALASKGIPCRGTISFGDFHVELDSENSHSIFFGKALIEAYQSESDPGNSEWIGISLCPSAWKAAEYADESVVKMHVNGGRFAKVEHNDCLRLNPFMKLNAYFVTDQIEGLSLPYHEYDVPEFPALDFILRNSAEMLANETVGRVPDKYHSTAKLFREMLSADCIKWSQKALAGFPATER